MDALYPCILGEINRLHYLDLLMEKWKDTATIQRLEKEVHSHRVEQMMDRITRCFDDYHDSGVDYEETIIDLGYALKSRGIRFFCKNRWKCFEEERGHDYDMYAEACTLVILAEVNEFILEEVPLSWYIHDVEELG